jgi:Ser/Thr protein kinase RdoA (MazF antagonist)
MAKLHQTTLNQELKRMDYDVNTLIQLPYQYATTHFSETIPEMQFLKYGGDQITAVFKEVDATKLRYGSVHLDLWYDNMNIENEETITIFDFDFCGNGWLLLDIAYFNLQLFNTEPDLKLYQLKSDAFFNGYQDITNISEEEFSLLPYAGFALWNFYLGVQSQRFDNWSNIFLSENYLKHFIGVIRKWLKYNHIKINGENEIYV